jgi:hypothetical protein
VINCFSSYILKYNTPRFGNKLGSDIQLHFLQNITICYEIKSRLTCKTKKPVMTWVIDHGQDPNKILLYVDMICVTSIVHCGGISSSTTCQNVLLIALSVKWHLKETEAGNLSCLCFSISWFMIKQILYHDLPLQKSLWALSNVEKCFIFFVLLSKLLFCILNETDLHSCNFEKL